MLNAAPKTKHSSRALLKTHQTRSRIHEFQQKVVLVVGEVVVVVVVA